MVHWAKPSEETEGVKTAWLQQRSVLKETHSDPDLCQPFLKDMIKEVKRSHEETKAKRLLLPRARGLHERHSHLPPQATETAPDVGMADRAKQAARWIQKRLLIAEPCLKHWEMGRRLSGCPSSQTELNK
jgi:hypothetical protein